MISRILDVVTSIIGCRPPRSSELKTARAVLLPVVFLFALGVMGTSSGASAQGVLQASFDWSMPDRFGPDVKSLTGAPGADGVRDYWITFRDTWSAIDPAHPEAGSPNINPSSWRVSLDASS